MSGTTGTTRTPSYLLTTSFPDGKGLGAILPQDVRDLVVSLQALTFGVASTPFVLTDGATIALDASKSMTYRVTLAGNRTLAFPTNLVAGQKFDVVIVQDATGSRTLAYGAGWKFPAGTAPVLSTAANAVDRITAVYDGTILMAAITKAFA